MKNILFLTLAGLVLVYGPEHMGDSDLRLFDVASHKETTLERALPEIGRHEIVLVGEFHNDEKGHMAELAVIKSLLVQ